MAFQTSYLSEKYAMIINYFLINEEPLGNRDWHLTSSDISSMYTGSSYASLFLIWEQTGIHFLFL